LMIVLIPLIQIILHGSRKTTIKHCGANVVL